MLIHDGDALVAVAVRLGAANGGAVLEGKWSLEAGFDHLGCLPDELFDDLDQLTRWVARRRSRTSAMAARED